MALSVGVGGTHRTVAQAWVGVGGVWRVVTRLSVGVGGVWRFAFASVLLSPTYAVSATANFPSDATATLRIDNDGHLYRVQNGITTDLGVWLTGGSAANYDALTTVGAETGAGLAPGSSTGLTSLATSPHWTVTQSVIGSSSATVTVSIRIAGTSTVIDTTTLTLTATVTP